MDNFCGGKKVLTSRGVRRGNFNSKFLDIGLPALEAQAATRDIFASHNIVSVGVAPDACFELHFRSNVLAPVPLALRRRRLRRSCNGNRSRCFFLLINPAHHAALDHLHHHRRLFGILRRAFPKRGRTTFWKRSEEHTSELQSRRDLVCRLLLEKKKKKKKNKTTKNKKTKK